MTDRGSRGDRGNRDGSGGRDDSGGRDGSGGRRHCADGSGDRGDHCGLDDFGDHDGLDDLGGRRLAADDRALSPVVGKAVEVGLVTVFVALLASALYGGVVPEYRTAAAEEVGDRALATAAERIETAVPPSATRVDSETRIDLPRTIRGSAYRIQASGSTLVLDHPRDRLDGRARLSLPPSVARVTGTWESDAPAVVRVDDTGSGLRVEIGSAETGATREGESTGMGSTGTGSAGEKESTEGAAR